jgi:trk system potassium uptake protein TrkA
LKIVIVGAGFTGVQLAKRLINEKNDVILIDNDESTVRHASNRLDCAVVQADGNNIQTLEDAGIAKADALVCVTESDEVNMITCSLADAVYPDILKIARVRNYAYYNNTSAVKKSHAEAFSGSHRPLYGIDYMIHPDVEAARNIVEAVKNGAVNDVLSFDGAYELSRITIGEDSALAGRHLESVRNLTDKPFLIAYVESDGKTSLPSGSTLLHPGDSIGLLTKDQYLEELFNLCGSHIQTLKRIALVGVGRVGSIVAESLSTHKKSSLVSRLLLHKMQQQLVIVDTDQALTNEASGRFPDANVFCADISDEGFIEEEKINTCDLVICATSNYELNLVAAAYLESLGVRKTVSLVASSAYATIARKIGVDVPVPVRDVVVDSIMSHLHGSGVTGIHTVATGEIEVVECVLQPNSPLIGKMLKDIARPGQFLIMLMQKQSSIGYQIPVGVTQLSVGDKAILVTQADKTQQVLRYFNGKD